jgi:23S rRNA pseudouridine1911/1915/1917 synthase
METLEVSPEKMDLDIVFEDNEIIIINKKPATNVHPVP